MINALCGVVLGAVIFGGYSWAWFALSMVLGTAVNLVLYAFVARRRPLA